MPNNEDVNKRLDAEAADVEISAFPTDRIELRLFDDGDIAMTVHYYANPDDYEAKQSVNVNYLMTEQGARVLSRGLNSMLQAIDNRSARKPQSK